MSQKSDLSSLFKQIDGFGEQISFRIDGKNSYNTVCGSITTVLMFCVLLFYGQQKFIVIKLQTDTLVSDQNNPDAPDENSNIVSLNLFTFLDIMASIGGLIIILYFIGCGLIGISNWLTGNELVIYFLTHLFKTEETAMDSDNKTESFTPWNIQQRKPFAVDV